ncbi:cytochrome b [Prosthecomicrobium sp. N25]|uniref:cytochrome b n=1 Tax=Prosthecomicrobium sp. N25 TaxID=3129254 RepID=UPI0030779067
MEAVESDRYRRPARVLHWLIAVLVIGNIIGGFVIANVEGVDTIYNLHRSTGFLIMVLAILRLLYRLTNPPPPLPTHMPALQKFAAEVVHWALYGFMIVTPIVGWAASNAFGAQVSIYWLFELPAIVGKDEALFKSLIAAHQWLGIGFLLAILVHIGGALFHTVVQKDGILARMWPV